MHTNQTNNYGLPQWVGTDAPAWLGDMNPALATIDTQIKTANDTANSASSTASSLATRLTADETNITNNQTAIGGLQTRITTAESDITGIKTLDGTTTITGIGNGTLTGAVSTLNQAIYNGSLNGEVVNISASGWNASSADARYPLAQTVAVVNKFTAPLFYQYSTAGLTTDAQDTAFSKVPKCIYDSTANTITFYSTAEDSSEMVDLSVRVIN